jgi:phage terminase small subunit
MTKPLRPPPPQHLSDTTRKWWKTVTADYQLEQHHQHLLRHACECLDRAEEAREALAQLGTTFVDKHGAPRVRPEVAIERDSRTAFCRCLRELDLDVEPPASARFGPPSLRSNRG